MFSKGPPDQQHQSTSPSHRHRNSTKGTSECGEQAAGSGVFKKSSNCGLPSICLCSIWVWKRWGGALCTQSAPRRGQHGWPPGDPLTHQQSIVLEGMWDTVFFTPVCCLSKDRETISRKCLAFSLYYLTEFPLIVEEPWTNPTGTSQFAQETLSQTSASVLRL